MAAGLQSSIWNNNLRSILLLAVYPFIVMGLVWACAAVFSGFHGGAYYGAYESGGNPAVSFANNFIVMYWPAIVAAVAAWFAAAYFFNTSMIRALSHAHPVTRKDEPALYNLLENLCIAEGMAMPRLEIIETHARNAFASGINDRTYTVTVTRGLLNSLSRDEVEAVLAHELTHILNRDVRLLIVTVIFTGMVGFAAQMAWSGIRHSFRFSRGGRSGNGKGGGNGIFVLLAIAAILWIGYMATLFTRFAISRRREFMADAGAVKMTKNPEAMMRALMRISGADRIPGAPADIDMMCIENTQAFMGLFATHPPIQSRIETIAAVTGAPVPSLPHTGPVAPGQEFGDKNRRNPWLSAQRKNVRNV